MQVKFEGRGVHRKWTEITIHGDGQLVTTLNFF